MIYNIVCKTFTVISAFQYVLHSCYRHVKDPCPIQLFNNICSFWCLFTISSVWVGGVVFVLPYRYGHSNDWALLVAHQIMGNFMGLEVLVNWLCIRWVDSGYVPIIHGSKPDPPVTVISLKKSNGASNLRELSYADDNQSANGAVNGTMPTKSSSVATPCEANGAYTDGNQRNGNCSGSSLSNSTMYVVSGFQGGAPKRTAYPYWSWVPCIMCNHYRPPRCHHCTLCGKCVLKRDHHCFFAGSCVGYRNMRHFIIFCMWATTGCVYAFAQWIPYYYEVMYPRSSLLDLLPVVVHVRCFLSYTDLTTAFTITLAWLAVFFLPLAAHFFYLNVCMTIQGQTTFERDANLKVRDCRPLIGRIHSIFGHYWMLNIVIPLHPWFDAIEDPVYWPHIKP